MQKHEQKFVNFNFWPIWDGSTDRTLWFWRQHSEAGSLEILGIQAFSEKASQFHEIISLFFYHLYRKFAREAVDRLLASDKKENVTETDGMEKQN